MPSNPQEFKQQFKVAFDEHVNSKAFIEAKRLLNISSLNFCIATNNHKEALIKFFSSTWSSQQSSFPALDISVQEYDIRAEDVITDCISKGNGIIASDSQSNIVGFAALVDLKDDMIATNHDFYTSKLHHFSEMIEYALNSFFKDVSVDASNIRFGDYLYGRYLTIHPKLKGSGLNTLLSASGMPIGCRLRYKFFFGISTAKNTRVKNKSVYRTLENVFDYKQYDFSNYTFKDGSTMQQYINNYAEKYGVNNDLNEHCILEVQRIQNVFKNIKIAEFTLYGIIKNFVSRKNRKVAKL
eukprot:1795_1